MKRDRKKKNGVAMLLALVVVFLVMVMGTSYLGITAASNISSKDYKKEAQALSFAQAGIEAMLNYMGKGDVWGTDTGGSNLCVLRPNPRAPLFITSNPTTDNNILHVNDDPNGSVRFNVGGAEVPRSLFEGLLPRNNAAAADPNNRIPAVQCATEEIPLPDGRVGLLYFIVVPELINGLAPTVEFGMPEGNINYVVAVAALIFEGHPDGETPWNSHNLIASRSVKVRVSHAFPGSIYNNMRAYNSPANPREDIFGRFSYPNAAERTADASFIDENSTWDGAIRVDGSSTTPGSQRWGAPKQNANPDSDFLTGPDDTSGSLKIAFLDAKLNDAAKAGKFPNEQKTKITKFNSIISTKKQYLPNSGNTDSGIVYQDIHNVAGRFPVTTAKSELVDNIKSNTAKLSTGRDGNYNATDSIWNTALADKNTGNFLPKLSGIDKNGRAIDGAFKQMAQDKSSKVWDLTPDNTNNKTSSTDPLYYKNMKADPLYAYEKPEVPTVRLTISENNKEQIYQAERVEYKYDNGKVSEVLSPIGTRKAKEFNGVIYAEGVNLQVTSDKPASQGGALKSRLTIVCDSSNHLEAENYTALKGGDPSRDSKIDRNINAPNMVDSSGKYKFIDATYRTNTNPENGAPSNALDLNNLSYDNNANMLMCQADPSDLANRKLTNKDGASIGDNRYVFPPDSELPSLSGNISVIGDIKYQQGSNASLALVAKNRVYLNNFDHKTETELPSSHATLDKNTMTRLDSSILSLDAVVASERQNMSMDFYNVSKNLGFRGQGNVVKGETANSSTRFGTLPGYKGSLSTDVGPLPNSGNFTSSSDPATFTDNNPYRVSISWDLAKKLNGSKGATNRSTTVSGNQVPLLNFLNKYTAMNDAAKEMLWHDYNFGAVRVTGEDTSDLQNIYANGIFDFKGAVISRFADVEADAGVIRSGNRNYQMGFVQQKMSFDANLLDKSAPFFSITNGSLVNSENIRWTVLSYVDKGSISFQLSNN